MPLGMWDLPRLEVEPVSPALAGRLLFSGPPKVSQEVVFVSFLLLPRAARWEARLGRGL